MTAAKQQALTDDEHRALEQTVEELKQAADALLAIARRQRQKNR